MMGKNFINWQLRFWRFVIPTTVFVLSIYAITEMRYPLGKSSDLILWLSRMEPLLLIMQIQSTLTIPDWIWLPILLILVTAFLGRIFCGWFCPMGGLLNLVYYSRPLFRKGSRDNMRAAKLLFLDKVRYWWLALVIVLAGAGVGIVSIVTPLTLFSHEITRLYLGYFPWLLAVAIISGFIFFPRFWCTYICPTGILFTLVSSWRLVKVRATDKCANCNHCKAVCPVNAVDTGVNGSSDECLVCGRCVTACSRQAMNWTGRKQSQAAVNMQSRRNFLKLGTAIAVGSLIALPVRRLVLAGPSASSNLRPPGAIPENDFLATCNRCSRCVKVCPTGGLAPMSISSGIMAYETPELLPRKGACDLCMQCFKICPTGAIRPVKIADIKIGIARLDELTCLAWAQDKACLICKERCPADAITIDARKRPYIDSQKCIGCGACENACPVNEAAVKVFPI